MNDKQPTTTRWLAMGLTKTVPSGLAMGLTKTVPIRHINEG